MVEPLARRAQRPRNASVPVGHEKQSEGLKGRLDRLTRGCHRCSLYVRYRGMADIGGHVVVFT